MAVGGDCPIHLWAMHPAAVMGVVGGVAIGVVVQGGQLISHIDQGNTTESGDDGVAQQNALHCQINARRIALGNRFLQPRQRGKAAGNAFVAGCRIFLKQHPA